MTTRSTETTESVWFSVYDTVTWFKDEMLRKLWAYRNRHFWLSDPDFDIYDALDRMKEEIGELSSVVYAATYDRDYQAVIDECADVANFSMMIANMAYLLDKNSKDGVQ
jgi:NTP pyrophosphatase (non-canonical NTP hydrolase)